DLFRGPVAVAVERAPDVMVGPYHQVGRDPLDRVDVGAAVITVAWRVDRAQHLEIVDVLRVGGVELVGTLGQELVDLVFVAAQVLAGGPARRQVLLVDRAAPLEQVTHPQPLIRARRLPVDLDVGPPSWLRGERDGRWPVEEVPGHGVRGRAGRWGRAPELPRPN